MIKKLGALKARLEEGKKDNKGFTLVELIVVIVILAILVGVTIGGVYGYVNKSRINTDINNASAITSTLQVLSTSKDVKGTANGDISTTISSAVTKADLTASTFGLGEDSDGKIKAKLQELFPDGIPATKTGNSYYVSGNWGSDGSLASIKVIVGKDASTPLDAQE